MTDPAEDLANELAEDRAIELCPASELPAWPPLVLSVPPKPKEEK